MQHNWMAPNYMVHQNESSNTYKMNETYLELNVSTETIVRWKLDQIRVGT